MVEQKPVWTSSSFLLYAGGLTVLGAALGALGYLAASYGKAAFAGWSLLVVAVLSAIAHAFKHLDRRIAAGIFAYASVVAWAVFLGALWNWFGWLDNAGRGSPFHGFSIARLGLEWLVLAAVLDHARRFRFPFIVSIGVVVGWLFVTDLISDGGNWSAVVTFFVGLAYLAAGVVSRRPSSFWFHQAAGALVGGALIFWWHASDWNWALVAIVSLLYVALARGTRRSSWAVLGTLGLLSATSHYATSWARGGAGSSLVVGGFAPVPYHGWVPPLVFAFTGFLLVALGFVVARRQTI